MPYPTPAREIEKTRKTAQINTAQHSLAQHAQARGKDIIVLDIFITIIGLVILAITIFACLLLLARRAARLNNPTQIAQAEVQLGPYHRGRLERASKGDGRWVKKGS